MQFSDEVQEGFLEMIRNLVKAVIVKMLPTNMLRKLWELGNRGVFDFHGVKLHMNRRDYFESAFLLGRAMPASWQLLIDATNPHDIVLDIGANAGITSLLCALKLNGAGQVYAFEPDPFVMSRLKRNLEANPRLAHLVTPVPIAASNFSGSQEFGSVVWGNLGTGALLAQSNGYIEESLQKGGMRKICVTTQTIDDWARSMGVNAVGIIKIDVEGHELAVLEGLRRLVTASLEVRIFVDVHHDFGVSGTSVASLLSSMGLQIEGWDHLASGEWFKIEQGTPAMEKAPMVVGWGERGTPPALPKATH